MNRELDRDTVIRSLHWLLARLHDSLATNKHPDPDVAEIAYTIADWYDEYRELRAVENATLSTSELNFNRDKP